MLLGSFQQVQGPGCLGLIYHEFHSPDGIAEQGVDRYGVLILKMAVDPFLL
jgi:hypothetical protein